MRRLLADTPIAAAFLACTLAVCFLPIVLGSLCDYQPDHRHYIA